MRARATLATLTALVVLVFALPLVGLAQQLSDDAIERALSTRGRALNAMTAGCAAGAPFGRGQPLLGSPIQPVGTISVTLATTAAHIAQLAADRERRYEPALTVETLPDELREVALWATTVPNPPTRVANITNIPAPVEQVIIRQRQQPEVFLRPTSREEAPVEYTVLGQAITANRVSARYSLSDAQAWPSADVEIVLVTPHIEQRCRINARDWTRVLSTAE